MAKLGLIISKFISYVISGTTLLSALPQIIKIIHAESTEGISLSSVSLTIIASSSAWAYSSRNEFPLSSYADSMLMTVQFCIIAILILYYSDRANYLIIYISVCLGFTSILFSPSTPLELLIVLQTSGYIGKVLQISANFTAGSTGVLSVVTQVIFLLRHLGRIFTSWQETEDSLMVVKYTIHSMLTLLICGQILFYWDSSDHSQTIQCVCAAECMCQ